MQAAHLSSGVCSPASSMQSAGASAWHARVLGPMHSASRQRNVAARHACHGGAGGKEKHTSSFVMSITLPLPLADFRLPLTLVMIWLTRFHSALLVSSLAKRRHTLGGASQGCLAGRACVGHMVDHTLDGVKLRDVRLVVPREREDAWVTKTSKGVLGSVCSAARRQPTLWADKLGWACTSQPEACSRSSEATHRRWRFHLALLWSRNRFLLKLAGVGSRSRLLSRRGNLCEIVIAAAFAGSAVCLALPPSRA